VAATIIYAFDYTLVPLATLLEDADISLHLLHTKAYQIGAVLGAWSIVTVLYIPINNPNHLTHYLTETDIPLLHLLYTWISSVCERFPVAQSQIPDSGKLQRALIPSLSTDCVVRSRCVMSNSTPEHPLLKTVRKEQKHARFRRPVPNPSSGDRSVSHWTSWLLLVIM